MSIIQGLFKRVIVLAVGCLYGTLVAIGLLIQTIKLGPSVVLVKKKRSKPPTCLENSDLGIHAYAHLENIRMHYVSNGSEDKPLMLLVHGFPDFWYSWRYQLREFKDNYRVVAVDLRGYGDTDKPSGSQNYAVPELVNDLKQMVTALGYENCVLVGHDWGGVLAWAFAEMFPDMISRLITLNCPNGQALERYITKGFRQFNKSWYMYLFQLPWLPEFLIRYNDFAAFDEMMNKESRNGVRSGRMTAEDVEAYKYTFSRNSLTGPINFYRAALSLDNLSHDWSKGGLPGSGARGITMPTLIIWGEEDAALDKALAQLSAEVCKNKVTIKYVEGASHWVQIDRPDLVNQYMREFLAED